jgi:hypothetical protein
MTARKVDPQERTAGCMAGPNTKGLILLEGTHSSL